MTRRSGPTRGHRRTSFRSATTTEVSSRPRRIAVTTHAASRPGDLLGLWDRRCRWRSQTHPTRQECPGWLQVDPWRRSGIRFHGRRQRVDSTRPESTYDVLSSVRRRLLTITRRRRCVERARQPSGRPRDDPEETGGACPIRARSGRVGPQRCRTGRIPLGASQRSRCRVVRQRRSSPATRRRVRLRYWLRWSDHLDGLAHAPRRVVRSTVLPSGRWIRLCDSRPRRRPAVSVRCRALGSLV